MDSYINFPGKALLLAILEGSSELGLRCTGHISHIVGSKEMIKQEHISVPSIPGNQSRLDVDKSRVLATNIGRNVPNLTPVIHKGLYSVRRYRGHLLVHSIIPFRRVLRFRLDRNIRSHNIIQGSPSSSILGRYVLLDCSKRSRPVLVFYHWILWYFIVTDLMPLLISIATNQSQVDQVGNGLALNSLHVFQIVNTKLQVGNSPD
jgi:hypothetical protein